MINNVLNFLEQSVEKYRDKVAFADRTDSITFFNLKEKAEAIGSFLSEYCHQRKAVAVMADKSVNTVCAFMGIVYAGCYYAYIDPRLPLERINSILDTLMPEAVLFDKSAEKIINNIKDIPFVSLIEDSMQVTINSGRLNRIRSKATDIDPLYAMFTSGSTGRPKGVLISHRSVIDFIDTFVETFGFESTDVFGNQAPLDFDVSVKDIYSGLKTGARVELLHRSFFTMPTKLMDYLDERNVTTLVWAVSALCVVSTMNGLEYKKPRDIKNILFSGETMPVKHLNHWKQFYPDAMYVNLYGPTEITCNCTYYQITKAFSEGEAIPIGKAFSNEKVFLLDDDNNEITEAGISGEICVSGTSVGLGYLNDREKTAISFTQNPLNKSWNEIIYRTGDIGEYDNEGQLYFKSRKDFQIKHMGHRIELEEIELALNAVSGVSRGCCVYFEEAQLITAFYEGTADSKSIVMNLKNRLPSFMIPARFIVMDKLPITKNGKIDRTYLKTINN